MAVGDTQVFPGFLIPVIPVLTQLSFQSHQLLFAHASAEVRGENTCWKGSLPQMGIKLTHKVMSPTRSPLSHQGRAGKVPGDGSSVFRVQDLKTGSCWFKYLEGPAWLSCKGFDL